MLLYCVIQIVLLIWRMKTVLWNSILLVTGTQQFIHTGERLLKQSKWKLIFWLKYNICKTKMDNNKRKKIKNPYFGKNEMKTTWCLLIANWDILASWRWISTLGRKVWFSPSVLPPSPSLPLCPLLLQKALHRERAAVAASYWSVYGTDAQECRRVPPAPQNHFLTHSENILLSTFSWNWCCQASLVPHIPGRKRLITKYYPCINDL